MGQSSFQPMCSATVCSVRPTPAKSDSPVFEIGGSRIFRTSDKSSEIMTTDPNDWRTPLVCYLENPDYIADRKVRRQALKYVMLDSTLYCRTIDSLLLKCLGSNQYMIVVREVHEDICGTYQSAHKIKCLLRCASFYWSTMLNDCFMYYKGYESCQKFRDVQLAPASMLHPIIKP
jgi:hypothetical protein